MKSYIGIFFANIGQVIRCDWWVIIGLGWYYLHHNFFAICCCMWATVLIQRAILRRIYPIVAVHKERIPLWAFLKANRPRLRVVTDPTIKHWLWKVWRADHMAYEELSYQMNPVMDRNTEKRALVLQATEHGILDEPLMSYSEALNFIVIMLPFEHVLDTTRRQFLAHEIGHTAPVIAELHGVASCGWALVATWILASLMLQNPWQILLFIAVLGIVFALTCRRWIEFLEESFCEAFAVLALDSECANEALENVRRNRSWMMYRWTKFLVFLSPVGEHRLRGMKTAEQLSKILSPGFISSLAGLTAFGLAMTTSWIRGWIFLLVVLICGFILRINTSRIQRFWNRRDSRILRSWIKQDPDLGGPWEQTPPEELPLQMR